MDTTPQLQHACNRESSSGGDLDIKVFKYDSNNVAAIQNARIQRMRAEEAARRHAEELEAADRKLASQIIDKEQAIKELIALRREYDTLQTKHWALNNDFKAKCDEVTLVTGNAKTAQKELDAVRIDCETLRSSQSSLNKNLLNANDVKAKLDTQVHNLGCLLGFTLRSYTTEMEKLYPNARQENCLPLRYHNSTVLIANRDNMAMVFDNGKDSDTKIHSWKYIPGRGNQIFKLLAMDGSSPLGRYWVISRQDERRLYLPSGGPSVEIQLAPSAPGKQDYWYIGRDSASYVGSSWIIKSVEWGTYLHLEGDITKDGGRIASREPRETDNPRWAIIPAEFV
ncbi:hypothetical protein TWF506_004649 [Arthrobotrys conoides]|uniref:Uncharacterized protein n=1 Tax=Arthrobotrys conoides TaxID=74498 RepID=A0AAN8N015_9PEZI